MAKRVYQNINRLINKGLQLAAVYVTDAIKSLTDEQANEVAAEVDEYWRTLASEKLGGKDKYLRDYLAGIQPVVISKGKIQFRLRGPRALQAELGWAPPDRRGAAIYEGLGTYDGLPHDMRPFLLWGSEDWEGHGKPPTQGTKFAFKILSLPFEGGTSSDFTESVRQYLEARVNPETRPAGEPEISAKKAEKIRKRFKANMAQLLADAREARASGNEGGAQLSANAVRDIPRSRTILWTETMKKPQEIRHRNFLFKGLRATHEGGSKFSFKILRTISDNPKQKDLWHAVGVPPINLLETDDKQPGPVMQKAIELLISRSLSRALKKRVPKTITVRG